MLSVMGSLAACAVLAHHAVPIIYGRKLAFEIFPLGYIVVGRAELFLWIILASIAVGVAMYVLRTLRWLLMDAMAERNSGSTLTGIVSVSCCERHEERPVRRLSLL
jgi:hypothetical protein